VVDVEEHRVRARRRATRVSSKDGVRAQGPSCGDKPIANQKQQGRRCVPTRSGSRGSGGRVVSPRVV
jgi:hypothetical protein